MKKLLFLSLLFSVAINAMESDSAYPGHQARQATTDRPPISQTNFSQKVIERAKKTDIFDACEINDIEVVKYFIANGTDVNETDNDGATPLYWAAYHNNTDLCKLLVQHVADVNKADISEQTPLYWAAYHNNTDLCKLFIQHGADVNKASKVNGETPLCRAACNNNTDLCKLFIQHGADVNKTDIFEQTPLLYAACNNNTGVCKLFVQHGADVNTASKRNGRTPLHWAACYGHTDIVRLLLQHRANIDQTDNDGATALHFAARTGHTETCQLLLQFGAQINQTDNDRRTPLHWAAYKDQTKVLFLLLSRQANLNITDENGKTPLEYGKSSALIKKYDKQLKSTLKMRCLETILDEVETAKEVLEPLHESNVPLEGIDDCSQCKKINVVNKITPCCNKKIWHQCWDSRFQEETTSNIQLVHDQTSKKVEQLIITLHATCPFCKAAHTKEKKERVAHTNEDQHTNESVSAKAASDKNK